MPKSDSTPVSVTSAVKSGLILEPSRYRNRLISGNYAPRLSTTVHVYSAAMMQTILSEVLKNSVEFCTADKRRTIDKEHIHAAIRDTAILAELFDDIDMFDVGVAQHVSPALVTKPKSRRRRIRKAPKKEDEADD